MSRVDWTSTEDHWSKQSPRLRWDVRVSCYPFTVQENVWAKDALQAEEMVLLMAENRAPGAGKWEVEEVKLHEEATQRSPSEWIAEERGRDAGSGRM